MAADSTASVSGADIGRAMDGGGEGDISFTSVSENRAEFIISVKIKRDDEMGRTKCIVIKWVEKSTVCVLILTLGNSDNYS